MSTVPLIDPVVSDCCTASFVVHGTEISTVDVFGVLDASASFGFEVVMSGLLLAAASAIDIG